MRRAGLLFFLSGFAGLTYQILWQRELGLLFGNTTQATATTLAVFFLGLAAGSWWFGRRAEGIPRPLRAFARLEWGIAAGALLLPLLLPLYRSLFAPLHGAVGSLPAVYAAVKFLLACLVLGPPAFLMGGTLPVLAELGTRAGQGLGRAAGRLYTWNTAGAVAGAFAAGFLLPRALGYRTTYAIALGVSLLVGVQAWLASRGETAPTPEPADPEPAITEAASPMRAVLVLAALSGFVSLALEVLWTRIFALVFINSVYSFAAVVVVFLLALALGAGAATWVGRRTKHPWRILRWCLLLAGLGVFVSALAVQHTAGQAGVIAREADFGAYLLRTFGVLGLYMFLPALGIGFLFPFLLRVEEERAGGGPAGPRLGALLAANTLGALGGALAAGFLLPPLLGAWRSIGLLAASYVVASWWFVQGLNEFHRIGWRLAVPTLVAVIVGVTFGTGEGIPQWLTRRGEDVLQVYEGSTGTVSVVERRGKLKLRFNESYTLGGTAQPRWEHYQSHIPLCLHPAPKRVCFLGLGTGITAGAALHHDVELVRIAEIVPQAVEASRDHFTPWVNGLYRDKRVDIVIEDGRTVLRAFDDAYDVVIGDLFLPWKRGTALLYTIEQFESVRARLAPQGLFAQWLPLYQMSEDEFRGIVRSFTEVFPDARLVRGDFFARRPIVALVGRVDAAPLDPERLLAAWQALEAKEAVAFGPSIASLPFLFLGGRLEGADLTGARANTDDRPWIQFESPISQRRRAIGLAEPFVGRALADFERTLLTRHPPEQDAWLARLSPAQQRLVHGGQAMYEYAVRFETGASDTGKGAFAEFLRNVPAAVRPPFGDWMK